MNNLESDIINYINHINTELTITFQGPKDKMSFDRVLYLSQQLGNIFNSLLGPCLLDAYKKSLKERPSYHIHTSGRRSQIGTEEYCDSETFYKELYESVKIHSGIFKQQVWIMTKGKLQKINIEEKPTPTKEKKTEGILKGLEGLGGEESEEEEPEETELEIEGEELDEDEEL